MHDYFSTFSTIIDDFLPRHNYVTRFHNNDNILIPPHRLSSTHRNFLINVIILWNTLPLDVKQIDNYNKF